MIGIMRDQEESSITKRKNAPAEPKWRHKYMYQLAGKYTPASLAALDDPAKAGLQTELDG